MYIMLEKTKQLEQFFLLISIELVKINGLLIYEWPYLGFRQTHRS